MPNETLIARREAILRVSAMLGVALVGGDRLLRVDLRRLSRAGTVGVFTDEDIEFLDEVADTILPTTSTPGAKAAHTGAFMALMVTDAYAPRDQRVFMEGMRALDDACKSANGVEFMEATPAQRAALVDLLDREQKAHSDARAPSAPRHYFRMMKELALLGYFTSEIGVTQAQRYVETPGRYDPCVPYARGERSWAPHA